MVRLRFLSVLFLAGFLSAVPLRAQIGKSVMVAAGSEADHQLNDISAATDPAAKLKLIDAFSAAHPEGDLQILVDEQYVNYYIGTKQYDKAFEYGDKLFALDPDSFSNAVNMVRAANEKGDADRLFAAGEKASGILQRFKAQPPPSGASPGAWKAEQQQKLESVKDNRDYIEQSLMSAAFQQKDAAKKAALLVRFANLFPDSPNAGQAFGAAAVTYQQAQNRQKMVETANNALEKDPNNISILLLLADDYSEKGEQLDKAEAYAKKAASLCDAAKKPEGASDADWQNQINLQKGLAFSALGQIDLEKKLNPAAVESLTKAAPLLKPSATVYARNQYRLGFAYLNVKNTAGAKQAFTDAASVDTPYKGPAQEKLKGLAAAKAAVKKGS
jgi:tetratricopeptide (TPR) repeat protein